jgi:hypothetical protein
MHMGRRRATALDPLNPLEEMDAQEQEFDQDFDEAQAAEARKVGDVADLDDEEFSEYEWNVYRIRDVEGTIRSGTRGSRVWVGKKSGPLDLSEIRAEFGGGLFEFWGKIGGRLRKRARREIEGEPIIRKAPPSATLPAANGNGSFQAPNGTQLAAPAPSEAELRLIRLRRQIRRERAAHEQAERDRIEREREARFEKLLEVIANRPEPPAAKPTGINELVQAVAGIHQLTGANAERESPTELMKTVLCQTGIRSDRTAADPADGTDPTRGATVRRSPTHPPLGDAQQRPVHRALKPRPIRARVPPWSTTARRRAHQRHPRRPRHRNRRPATTAGAPRSRWFTGGWSRDRMRRGRPIACATYWPRTSWATCSTRR